MLIELRTPKDASLVVVHWSKFGTHRLYIDTPDGEHVGWVDLKTGRRSLAMPLLAHEFEVAVNAAEQARIVDLVRSERAVRIAEDEVQPAVMRHAYRGKAAYSRWELGPCGNRLIAEDDPLVSEDPHRAYLNAVSVR
ncbi:MAG: hypothetical protein ACOH1Y_05095 [Propionicimonas sp.]